MAAKPSRIPKGIKNSIWSVIDASLYPAVYMALVPSLMKGMGPAAFGLWIVLNTLMTSLQLFNLNIGITTIKQIAAFASQNDKEGLNKITSDIIKITFFLLLIVFVLGVFISIILPYCNFLGITSAIAGNSIICVLLTTFITGIKFFDQVFQGILKGFEQYKAAAILNLFNRIGLLVLTVLLAISHESIISLLIANIVFTIIYLSIHFIVIKSLIPSIQISFKKGKVFSKKIISFSKWLWFQSIIVVLAFQTDRFWVSSYSGLKEVAAYGLVATMFNHIHMIFIAMAAWVFPRISGMISMGTNPQRIYNHVQGLLLITAVILLIAFYYASPFIFNLWVGNEIYSTMAPYIKGFTLFELLFVHTIMPFFYLNASGKEKVATYATLFYSIICYASMIAGLFFFHQTLSMIYGMVISLCITMPVVNFLVKKQINNMPTWKKIGKEMLPFYLTVVLICLPKIWMSWVLLPFVLFILYQFFLSPILEERLWKLQEKR